MEDSSKVWLDRLLTRTKLSDTVLDKINNIYCMNTSKKSKFYSEYSSVVNNILKCVINDIPKLYINLNKNYYQSKVIINGNSINPKINYAQVLKVIGFLEDKGLVTVNRGYRISSKFKEDGYIKISQEFESFIRAIVQESGIAPKFKNNLNALVVLGGDDKPLVLKGENKMLGKEFITFVSDFNDWIAEQEIYLDDIEITAWLCRIFKENLQQHGRFYNVGQIINYQTLSQIKRGDIVINGEGTIELDYKHIHPSILYELADIERITDMYDVGVKEYTGCIQTSKQVRNIVKDSLLRMLNTSSRSGAIASVTKMLQERDNEVDTLFSRYGDVSNVDLRVLADQVVSSIEESHSEISGDFYSNKALGLMGLDSQIMNNVLMSCKEDGIVALPLHDSIIVPESEGLNASVIMREAYEKVLGSDYNCKIDIK